MNPNIKKGNWTKEEDKKLIDMILEENGQRKWSKFVESFNGTMRDECLSALLEWSFVEDAVLR